MKIIKSAFWKWCSVNVRSNVTKVKKMFRRKVLNVIFLGQQPRIRNTTQKLRNKNESTFRLDLISLKRNVCNCHCFPQKYFEMEASYEMKFDMVIRWLWKVKSHFENWFSCKIDWFFVSCSFHCLDSSKLCTASMANQNKLRITLNTLNQTNRWNHTKKTTKSSQSSLRLQLANGVVEIQKLIPNNGISIDIGQYAYLFFTLFIKSTHMCICLAEDWLLRSMAQFNLHP